MKTAEFYYQEADARRFDPGETDQEVFTKMLRIAQADALFAGEQQAFAEVRELIRAREDYETEPRLLRAIKAVVNGQEPEPMS